LPDEIHERAHASDLTVIPPDHVPGRIADDGIEARSLVAAVGVGEDVRKLERPVEEAAAHCRRRRARHPGLDVAVAERLVAAHEAIENGPSLLRIGWPLREPPC